MNPAAVILIDIGIGFVSLLITAWMLGAIYFDVGQGGLPAAILAMSWAVIVFLAFALLSPIWIPHLLLITSFTFLLLWWLSQKPSNERDWNKAFSKLACVEFKGDRIVVKNVRNFEYRTLNDYEINFETRTYFMSKLCGIDIAIAYWGSRWMCHPMLVFDFGKGGRLCISIEVRYRVNQSYNFLRSLYRQQELIYVVSDERDAILRRTKYSPAQDVYLYRLFGDREEIHKMFEEYVTKINQLVECPCWYHGLTANCTVSIYRQRDRTAKWDWRFLFNGTLDRMLYDRKRLNTMISFESLKRGSHINAIANQAPRVGFGDAVREALPFYCG